MTTNPRAASIERATGRSWDAWVQLLDGLGARDLSHQEIARRTEAELTGTVEQAGWWAQSVAVAYEQHIGRRLPGQRTDGTFQANVSRATSLPMSELMDRWAAFADDDATVRETVAGGPPRVGGTERRLTWRVKAADGSAVVVTSEPRANGTASLVVTHSGLPDPEAHAAARDLWTAVAERFLATL